MKKLTFAVEMTLASLLALGSAAVAQAQGTINATALVNSVPNGGNYNYTITLNNLSSSTDPIQTFWFAWFPGTDLLPSQPSSIITPNNWTASVQGGNYYVGPYLYPDGFSIEFTTQDSGSAITPGGSLSFQFTSPDSPATLGGNSPYPYYAPGAYAVGIAYVYAGGASSPGSEPAGDFNSFQSVVPAPEPSTFGLVALGAAMLFITRKRLAGRKTGA
jgi:hypothetical protein